MKRIWIVLLCLLLTGCSTLPTPTRPTTTDFPYHKTPSQILSEGIAKTAGATSFSLSYTVSAPGKDPENRFTALLIKDGRGGYRASITQACGCGLFVSGKEVLRRDHETGAITKSTADAPYALDFILADLPDAANTQGILHRFELLGPTASPSNTGITRFSMDHLSLAQTHLLLTGQGFMGADDPDFAGFFAMDLDIGGYLCCVELKDTEGSVHRYSVTRINENLTVEAPQWAANP